MLLSTNTLSDAQRIAILKASGLEEAEAKAKLQTLGLATANNTATASTFSLSGSLKYLYNVIAANPVMALTMAFTALVTIYQTVQRKQEEARQAAIDMANQYDEQAKAIEDLRQKYINIVDSESDAATKTEELNEWKQTLNGTEEVTRMIFPNGEEIKFEGWDI